MQDKIQEAIALFQAGKKEAARQILKRLVAEEPDNEAAWVWLIAAAETEKEKNQYKEQLAARQLDRQPAPKKVIRPLKSKADQNRRFTAADVQAIRETFESRTRGFLAGQNARPSTEVARVHDLNEAQIYAIRSLPKQCKISDEEIAAKLHLLTDQMQTVQDVVNLYGLKP